MKNGGKNKSVAFIFLFSVYIYIYIYKYIYVMYVQELCSANESVDHGLGSIQRKIPVKV